MSIIASIKGSHTHPAKNDRLAYIATGWQNAAPIKEAAPEKGKEANPTQVAATPEKEDKNYIASSGTPSTTYRKPVAAKKSANTRMVRINESIKSNNVVSVAYFDNDPQGHYYLTKRGNLVQVEGDKVYQVAKMYKSNKIGYNIMFADNNAHKIYIGRNGLLLNSTGNRVGYIKAR
ncbi:hypothetical protein [Flavobacterium rhizosphaerae]|uniref:Uncharacterized protein n=1 Tax=Flavobacterium rhizosphaerae TaxID=3163298 RepID=A0ABW8Z1T0_9FLAO